MAEEKTTKVFVRLTRGFPTGVTHRRGGVALTAGPTPVEADVTAEQLEALKSDHYVEIVSKKEAEKWAKYNEAQPEHPSADELAGEGGTGRNYGDGNQDGSGSGSNADDSDEDEEEDLTALSFKDLQAKATELEVENVGALKSKQALIEAIESKQAETPDEE